MKRIEDHCVNCGLPCLGGTCSNRNVEVYYCDECDDEITEVYEVDDEELCEDCLKKMFLKKEC